MMDYKIDIIELATFNNMVDEIITDIESGKIKANPLKREFTAAGDIIVGSTTVEEGEDTIVTLLVEECEFDLSGLDHNVGIILKNKVTNVIVAVYKTAADAARGQGVHQTTARERSKKDFLDTSGLIWSYYKDPNVESNTAI